MTRIGRWMVALIAVISLAGFVAPAEAQVVVIGHRHHHHHHHHHYHHYYR